MASLAPSNYDKNCQLYWDVPRLIFNSEIYSHPAIWTRLVNAIGIVCE